MSRRNKLAKFAEIARLDNVYENFSVENPQLLASGHVPVDLRGKWGSAHFGNGNPITLELACGRGEYTVALAREFPDRNFIGVDIKGARIWKGARIAHEERIVNAAFLRTRIECIDVFFDTHEVSDLWITFPDPFPRNGQANRRLTAPVFLDRYRQILAPAGRVHLKTDNTGLFLFTLEVIAGDDSCTLEEQIDDIDQCDHLGKELEIPTHYERIHREEGKKIKYLRFTIG